MIKIDRVRMDEALASPAITVPPGLSSEEKVLFIMISAIKPDSEIWNHLIANGWTPPWQPMESAPMDGTEILLKHRPLYRGQIMDTTPLVDIGSYRWDELDISKDPSKKDWFDNSYDYESPYAVSNRLTPISWRPIL